MYEYSDEGKEMIAAAEIGDVKKIKEVVARGETPLEDYQQQILYAACDFGHINIIEFLSDKLEEIYEYSEQKYFVNQAAREGHLDIVKYFIENGYDIKDEKSEVLQTTCLAGQLEVVKYLVEQGADIHVRNEHALSKAAFVSNMEIVDYLVEKGADIHCRNDTLLKRSAQCGSSAVVLYLIDKGCDPKIGLEYGTEKVQLAIADSERAKFMQRLQRTVPQAKGAETRKIKI